MLEQYALYLVLKEIINKLGYNFKISFNDYDINGDNVIGIIFKSGNNPKYRDVNTGKYYGYTNRVQFIIQSSFSKDSIINTLELMNKIRNSLISDLNNNIYIVPSLKYSNNKITEDINNNIDGDNIYIGITSTHLIGDSDFKGKTSQNRSVYSLNILFNYYMNIGGK